jgi:hypothetical protein
MLDDCLRSAVDLLGTKHKVMPVVNELLVLLVTAEEINLDMVQEDAAYIARALEDRFDLRAGGGHGSAGFFMGELPGLGKQRSLRPPLRSHETSGYDF